MWFKRLIKTVSMIVLVTFSLQTITSAAPYAAEHFSEEGDCLAGASRVQHNPLPMMLQMLFVAIGREALDKDVRPEHLERFIRTHHSFDAAIGRLFVFRKCGIDTRRRVVTLAYTTEGGVSEYRIYRKPAHIEEPIAPSSGRVEIGDMVIELVDPSDPLIVREGGPAASETGDVTGAAEGNGAVHESRKRLVVHAGWLRWFERVPVLGRLLKDRFGVYVPEGPDGVNDVIRQYWGRDAITGREECPAEGMEQILSVLRRTRGSEKIAQSIRDNKYRVWLYDTERRDFAGGVSTHYGIRTGNIHITRQEYERLKALGWEHVAARVAHEVCEIDSWRKLSSELIWNRHISSLGLSPGAYDADWASGIRKWIRENVNAQGTGDAQRKDSYHHKKGVDTEINVLVSKVLTDPAGQQDPSAFYEGLSELLVAFREGDLNSLIANPTAASREEDSPGYLAIRDALNHFSSPVYREFFLECLYLRTALEREESRDGGLDALMEGEGSPYEKASALLGRVRRLMGTVRGIGTLDKETRSRIENFLDRIVIKAALLPLRSRDSIIMEVASLRERIFKKASRPFAGGRGIDPEDVLGSSSNSDSDSGYSGSGDTTTGERGFREVAAVIERRQRRIRAKAGPASPGSGHDAHRFGQLVCGGIAGSITRIGEPAEQVLPVSSIRDLLNGADSWLLIPGQDSQPSPEAEEDLYTEQEKERIIEDIRQIPGNQAAARDFLRIGRPDLAFGRVREMDPSRQRESLLVEISEAQLQKGLLAEARDTASNISPDSHKRTRALSAVARAFMRDGAYEEAERSIELISDGVPAKTRLRKRLEEVSKNDAAGTTGSAQGAPGRTQGGGPGEDTASGNRFRYIEGFAGQEDFKGRLYEAARIAEKLIEPRFSTVLETTRRNRNFRMFLGSSTGYFEVRANPGESHEIDIVVLVDGQKPLQIREFKPGSDMPDDIARALAELDHNEIAGVTLKIVGTDNVIEAFGEVPQQADKESNQMVRRERTQRLFLSIRKEFIPVVGGKRLLKDTETAGAVEAELIRLEQARVRELVESFTRVETDLEDVETEGKQLAQKGLTGEQKTRLRALKRDVQQKTRQRTRQTETRERLERELKACESRETEIKGIIAGFKAASLAEREEQERRDRYSDACARLVELGDRKRSLRADLASVSSDLERLEAELEGIQREIDGLDSRNSRYLREKLSLREREDFLQRKRELLLKRIEDAQHEIPVAEGSVIAGKYRITGQIGAGGVGVVYSAVDMELGGQKAIKFLNRGSEEKSVRRFEREQEVMRTLDPIARRSPIPTWERSGIYAGRKYFVMTRVPGISLKSVLERQKNGEFRLTSRQKIILAWALSLVLAEFHSGNVIHRDITPANIIIPVDDNGDPVIPEVPDVRRAAIPGSKFYTELVSKIRIIDLGLALPAERWERDQTGSYSVQQDTASITGEFGKTIVGTPAYMPPEQATGTTVPHTLGDCYSLGVIIFELLSHNSPYPATADSFDFIIKITEGETRRLMDVIEEENRRQSGAAGRSSAADADHGRSVAQMDGYIEALIAKMLSRRRDERLTAARLAEELAKHLDGNKREMVCGTSRLAEAVGDGLINRMKPVLTLVGSVVIVAALVVGVSWYWAKNLMREAGEMMRQAEAREAESVARIESMKEEKQDTEARLASLKEEQSRIKAQKAALEQQMADLREGASEVLAIKEERDALVRQKAELEEQKEAAARDVAELKAREERLMQRARELSDGIQQAEEAQKTLLEQLARARERISSFESSVTGLISEAKTRVEADDPEKAMEALDRIYSPTINETSAYRQYDAGMDEMLKLLLDKGYLEEAQTLQEKRLAQAASVSRLAESDELNSEIAEASVRNELYRLRVMALRGNVEGALRSVREILSREKVKAANEWKNIFLKEQARMVLRAAYEVVEGEKRRKMADDAENIIDEMDDSPGKYALYAKAYILRGEFEDAARYFRASYDLLMKAAREEGLPEGESKRLRRKAGIALVFEASAYIEQAIAAEFAGDDDLVKTASAEALKAVREISKDFKGHRGVLAFARAVEAAAHRLSGNPERARAASRGAISLARGVMSAALVACSRVMLGEAEPIPGDSAEDILADNIMAGEEMPYFMDLKLIEIVRDKIRALQEARRRKKLEDARAELSAVRKAIQSLTADLGKAGTKEERAAIQRRIDAERKREGILEDALKNTGGGEDPAGARRGAGNERRNRQRGIADAEDVPDHRLVNALIAELIGAGLADFGSGLTQEGIRVIALGNGETINFRDLYDLLGEREREKVRERFYEEAVSGSASGKARLFRKELELLGRMRGHAGVVASNVYYAAGQPQADALIQHEIQEMRLHQRMTAAYAGAGGWEDIPAEDRPRAVADLRAQPGFNELALDAHRLAQTISPVPVSAGELVPDGRGNVQVEPDAPAQQWSEPDFKRTVAVIAAGLASIMGAVSVRGTELTSSEKGVILFADDIVNGSAVFDMAHLAGMTGGDDRPLKKIVLYARNRINADIIKTSIEEANPQAEVRVILESDLMRHFRDDFFRVPINQSVTRYAVHPDSKIFSRADEVLGVVRGPLAENEDAKELENEMRRSSLRVPVVIFRDSAEGNVYSLVQAVGKLIDMRASGNIRDLLCILPPVTRISDTLKEEYLKYVQMLRALEASL